MQTVKLRGSFPTSMLSSSLFTPGLAAIAGGFVTRSARVVMSQRKYNLCSSAFTRSIVVGRATKLVLQVTVEKVFPIELFQTKIVLVVGRISHCAILNFLCKRSTYQSACA